MQKLAFIGLAGAAGALCRYAMAAGVQRFSGASFPIGTFAVNVLGCFLFGLLSGLFEGRMHVSPETRFALMTGFLGAFTTFSTYAFESSALLRDGEWLAAALNIGGQVALGLAAVILGLNLARAV